MEFSRRHFMAGVSATGAVALSGLLGELRVHAAEDPVQGLRLARILFNENPLGPSLQAIAAIEKAMPLMSRYSMGENGKLETKLRKLHGLPFEEPTAGLSLNRAAAPEGSSSMLLGVGSSEILKAVAWAYCSEGGNVVEAHPGYSAVGVEAAQLPHAKATRKLVPLDAQQGLDVAAMRQAIDHETKVVVVCNPNNPTGSTLTISQIEQLADATPADALLLVDEAYIEFLEDEQAFSAVELAKSRPNVLVARTFSKIYGLAGLRIGYGLGARAVIDKLQPYMLGGLSLSMAGVVAANAALDDQEHIQATRELNFKVQESWKKTFPQFDWKLTPSDACFGWIDVGQDCSSLVRFLASRQVLIGGGQRWDLPNYVRISIGTEEENDRLLAGVRAFMTA